MTRDPANKLILSRRARFLAAAMAGVGMNLACSSKAEACLSQIAQEDAKSDGDTDAAGDGAPVPDACLGVPWEDTGTVPPDTGDGG